MERTAQWYYSGYEFLNRINPDRYSLRSEYYLEGCYIHYKLIDEETTEQIGPEVIFNSLQQTFESDHLCKTI